MQGSQSVKRRGERGLEKKLCEKKIKPREMEGSCDVKKGDKRDNEKILKDKEK